MDSMKEINSASRKTIYISDELVKKCGILFGEAEVDSFSGFVSKALNHYIETLVVGNNNEVLSKGLRQTIKNELTPITSRLSKGLYRYALEIDMIYQILFYSSEMSPTMESEIRRRAYTRISKMRGKIDLQQLLNDGWIENESEDDSY